MPICNAIFSPDEIIMKSARKIEKHVKYEIYNYFNIIYNSITTNYNQMTEWGRSLHYLNFIADMCALERIISIHFSPKTSRGCDICNNSFSTANTVIYFPPLFGNLPFL